MRLSMFSEMVRLVRRQNASEIERLLQMKFIMSHFLAVHHFAFVLVSERITETYFVS